MINGFNNVPDEVESLKDSGIFDIYYTHVTSHTAREGIEKTGKLMAPRIALAHDIVPFSGECMWQTYLIRAYYVSVSDYLHGDGEHHWQRYLGYAMSIWTPESSKDIIAFLEEEKKRINERKYNLADWNNPSLRNKLKTEIDGCIALEKLRQERYSELSEKEREGILNPKPEIYVFNDDLWKLLSRERIFGENKLVKLSHPIAPGEIKLERYLTGMFTSLDVTETREWVSSVVERYVPVGSLDALATWEEMNRPQFKIAV